MATTPRYTAKQIDEFRKIYEQGRVNYYNKVNPLTPVQTVSQIPSARQLDEWNIANNIRPLPAKVPYNEDKAMELRTGMPTLPLSNETQAVYDDIYNQTFRSKFNERASDRQRMLEATHRTDNPKEVKNIAGNILGNVATGAAKGSEDLLNFLMDTNAPYQAFKSQAQKVAETNPELADKLSFFNNENDRLRFGRDAEKTMDEAYGKTWYGQIARGLGEYIPSMALGLGAIGRGVTAAGGATTKALDEGHNKNTALAYGAVKGAFEGALSRLVGGVPQANPSTVVSGHLSHALRELISNDKVRNVISMMVSSMGMETFRGYLSRRIEPLARNLMLKEDNKISFWNEGEGMSMLTDALLGGITRAVNIIRNGTDITYTVDGKQYWNGVPLPDTEEEKIAMIALLEQYPNLSVKQKIDLVNGWMSEDQAYEIQRQYGSPLDQTTEADFSNYDPNITQQIGLPGDVTDLPVSSDVSTELIPTLPEEYSYPTQQETPQYASEVISPVAQQLQDWNTLQTQSTPADKAVDAYNMMYPQTYKNILVSTPYDNLSDVDKSIVDSFTPYSEQEIKNLSSGNHLIAGKDNFEEFVINSINNPPKEGEYQRFYLGKIGQPLSTQINNEISKNLNNYDVILWNNDISHILKTHGSASTEIPRGQIPITKGEILLIPQVFNNPDTIKDTGEKDSSGRDVILFVKQLSGKYILATGIKESNHSLIIDSIFVINNKAASPTNNGYNPPAHNVQNVTAPALSDNNLPQSPESVNTQGSVMEIPNQDDINQYMLDNTRIKAPNLTIPQDTPQSPAEPQTPAEISRANYTARSETAEGLIENAASWKDKKTGIGYSINTQERNIRDIADPEEAEAIIKEYFEPVHLHEKEKIDWINSVKARVSPLNLNKYESAMVQIDGEIPGARNRSEEEYNHLMLVREDALKRYGKRIDMDKVNKAIPVFKQIYAELWEQMNNALVREGYAPLGHIEDYFPHYSDERLDNFVQRVLRRLGFNSQRDSLPTDLIGLTQYFRPGRRWNPFTQKREGFLTDYNALLGLDRYLDYAGDTVYHTGDIKNLRAFEDSIRYKFGNEGLREEINNIRNNETLTEEQKQVQLASIQSGGHLNNYVVNLRRYTDNLAGKKDVRDRGMEEDFGRGIYKLANNMQSRVYANMVAGNISSALTNYIPIIQVGAEVKTSSLLKGLKDTITNYAKTDDIDSDSVFLTGRYGSDTLFKDPMQKVAEFLSKPFEFVDHTAANVVVRTLFNEGLSKGLRRDDALAYADKRAAEIMAARTKGALPNTFNVRNPIYRTIKAMQVETVNQIMHIAKDIPREAAERGAGWVILTLLKLFMATALINPLWKRLTGRGPMLDPIGIINDTIGDFTGYKAPLDLWEMVQDIKRGDNVFETQKKNTTDAFKNLGRNIAEEIPFVGSLFGGGRLPIQGAIPFTGGDGVLSEIGKISDKERSWDSKKQLLYKELSKPAFYFLPPMAGSQAKKTFEGLKTMIEGGRYSYDKQGNKQLQYPVESTISNWIRAGLFGSSATKEGQEWADSGFGKYSVPRSELMQKALDIGIDRKIVDDYFAQNFTGWKDKYGSTVKNSSLFDEFNYINDLNISDEQKELLLSNLREFDDDEVKFNKYVVELTEDQKSKISKVRSEMLSELIFEMENSDYYNSLSDDDKTKYLGNLYSLATAYGKKAIKADISDTNANLIDSINRGMTFDLLQQFKNERKGDNKNDILEWFLNNEVKLSESDKWTLLSTKNSGLVEKYKNKVGFDTAVRAEYEADTNKNGSLSQKELDLWLIASNLPKNTQNILWDAQGWQKSLDEYRK